MNTNEMPETKKTQHGTTLYLVSAGYKDGQEVFTYVAIPGSEE